MRCTFVCAACAILWTATARGQASDDGPRFAIADVHSVPRSLTGFGRAAPARSGRYEIRGASMLDLVRFAYGFDPDKILGGPSWLELDRFDVIAKLPAESTPDTQKLMLQALLRERFQLAVHKDTQSLPTYALTVGKKPQMKEADGSEETGCKPQTSSGAPAEPGRQIVMMNQNGQQTTIAIGPGMTIQYNCRNMTMDAFAAGLRGLLGASLGPNPVLNQTGLKGNWNFELRYSLGLIGLLGAEQGDRISIFDAVEKQLGLKLEQRPNPTPVIVVDSVNRMPSENPPGVAEALGSTAAPTEFEVAEVKPTDPDFRGGMAQMQPGGRFRAQGMPLRFLLTRAFNITGSAEQLVVPKWADSERFDITALAPPGTDLGMGMASDTMPPMLRALLVDRFKMTYHTEDRPVSAYSLVAAKPKMKKADPAGRTSCKNAPGGPTAPPGSIVITCQNVTMELLAERLRNVAPNMAGPVTDATGIEGGWDFTLTFSQLPPNLARGPVGGDAGQPAGLQTASDPSGGYTIFEALEKQLGLKLEPQKKSLPVTVIDHLEQRPVDN